jgi:hypothetical protein
LKSTRENVPLVRFDLSKTGMCGAISFFLTAKQGYPPTRRLCRRPRTPASFQSASRFARASSGPLRLPPVAYAPVAASALMPIAPPSRIMPETPAAPAIACLVGPTSTELRRYSVPNPPESQTTHSPVEKFLRSRGLVLFSLSYPDVKRQNLRGRKVRHVTLHEIPLSDRGTRYLQKRANMYPTMYGTRFLYGEKR